MPVRVRNRREERRSRMPGFRGAVIEFTGPDGTALKRPLVGLSVSGGSFQLAERIRGLEVGTTGEACVIRVGESEIHVNFEVRHVTHAEGKRYECGVQLYMMSDQDRNEIAALISRLQRSGSG